ncbi:antibiotic biosynthesis monooxygenase family protein [Pontibacter harenae]|uniref:antibiotic biosynthesis monooxygenase family protein n=1 Tax=Pontibacter harenae TaxID=2894083 RepID=UPI001E643065|nr:antibiotic biosynthesis monooxygenase [Pontibacter harenae]MCC9167238.1 antibiotic biosynthesis monooxygenase [Pontibacter harenae]
MFISISSFEVANDMAPEVKEAFRNRPHLVDDAPGFIKLQVLSPQENLNEIWLMTYWTDEESFQVWYKSHMYHDVHKGIPKGLKLVPGSVKVRGFEHVTE